MLPHRRARAVLSGLIVAAMLVAGCAPERQADPVKLGLFTSLPVMWHETSDIADMLRSDVPPHWALPVLQRLGPLRPIDSLLPPPQGIDVLILAQPRVLAPAEAQALDGWVRKGGRVLLFADPMLTQESIYAPGDRRRPQDVAMISPNLTQWGLALAIEEDQPGGERTADWLGTAIPVNLPGHFTAIHKTCRIEAQGLVARCVAGAGQVLAVADAALFEQSDEPGSREAALEALVAALHRGN